MPLKVSARNVHILVKVVQIVFHVSLVFLMTVICALIIALTTHVRKCHVQNAMMVSIFIKILVIDV